MTRSTYTFLLQALIWCGHCLKEYPEMAPVIFTLGNVSVTLSFRIQVNHLVGSWDGDSAMKVKSKQRGWWVQTSWQCLALGVKTVVMSPPWKQVSANSSVIQPPETEANKMKCTIWYSTIILSFCLTIRRTHFWVTFFCHFILQQIIAEMFTCYLPLLAFLLEADSLPLHNIFLSSFVCTVSFYPYDKDMKQILFSTILQTKTPRLSIWAGPRL